MKEKNKKKIKYWLFVKSARSGGQKNEGKMTAREILQSYPLDTCQKVKYDKGKGESEMTELKKKINQIFQLV